MAQDTTLEHGGDVNAPQLGKFIEPSLRHALPYYLPLVVFPLIFLALINGGWWLIPPFLFMSIAGPMDRVFGPDGRNINPKQTPEKRLIWHNIPVWTWAFLWVPTLIFSMWQILVANPFTWWEETALVFIVTMEAQAVFIIGHELVHRRTTWERRLAEFLLASASYPQYATEHVYIHHAQVGTPNDAGSPPKGESFWHYFPKEVVSNLTHSWKTARARLARSHRSVWHYTNPFWRYGTGLLFWYGLTFWMGGIWAVLVFIVLGIGCVFSMKIINYCQHYGLRRVRLENGRWEKIMPRHSWDADWKYSNWVFFNIQRHADHHAMASRHYPLLQIRHEDESPRLPGTYSDMMGLVIRPKKWFETMDPLVDQWRKHFYPEIDNWRAYDSPLAASHPDSFDAILEIFALAPRLANRVERNPELLENLQDREFTDLDLPKGFGPDLEFETTARRGLTRLYWTHEMGVQALRELIEELPAANAKDSAEIVRNWSNDKAFQIGMHLLRGNLLAHEAMRALSNLAEASIAAVLSAVLSDYSERNGTLTEAGVTGLVLGDLASQEANPDVPIEMLFVYDGQKATIRKHLAPNFVASLATLAKDSLLFSNQVNMRDACVVLHIDEVQQHFLNAAKQGKTDSMKMRAIFECGDIALGPRLDEIKLSCIEDYRNSDSLLDALKQDTAKVDSASSFSLEELDNVLAGLEQKSRHIYLTKIGHSFDDVAPTAESIFNLAGMKSHAEEVAMMRNLKGIHSLISENGTTSLSDSPKAQQLLASACGFKEFNELISTISQLGQTLSNEEASNLASPA